LGKNSIRYVHELTLSLTVAYAITCAKLATDSPLSRFCRFMALVENQFPPYEGHNPAAAFPASIIVAVALAACFFVFLRLLSRTQSSVGVLRWAGGIFALFAMPATWFYVPYVMGRFRFYSAMSTIILLVTSAVAAVCAGRYLCGLWPVGRWGSAALLSVYYIIWTWALIAEY
jgi:hypothetical protein